ncbi:hypothetical protein [Alkalihalobacillus sp. AL-G]|uniref:hypothetical protein n=1 Tax=Alkalihalobacillus sp. AL-G TaxID=2926399 RepID=UPI00272C73A1|nr:hypothetical protein [Alkalihalobacillus sp. AL-G]WLD92530.1 hypothetical protein MOJ78_16145 [Alkalihalobacillus sp. AL-G]
MDPRLVRLLQLTSLYGTLAKFYEHRDPERHIHFYKQHFMYESQLVQLYWSLQGSMESHEREHYPGG